MDPQATPAPALSIAFKHRCPACRKGALYAGFMTVRSACDACGLDYNQHDVGDGPAFFAITLLGFVVVGLAFALEVYVHPPYWVHALVVVAATGILTPLTLRFFKSYLIALKYTHHWSQGIE